MKHNFNDSMIGFVIYHANSSDGYVTLLP